MIRPATLADIPSLIDLERACDTAAHWPEHLYRQVFESGGPGRLVFVADGSPEALLNAGVRASSGAGTSALGFLVARHVALEWELENIVVAPTARRKGLGKRLLDALLFRVRETHSDAVFLEVRDSNIAARSLYEMAGFKQVGSRKSYYTNPTEDAILYRWNLR